MAPGVGQWQHNPKAFVRLVADLPTDPAAHAQALVPTPPSRRYVILFSPRSGSTWLAATLGATRLLGHPYEHLHPDVARQRAIEAHTTDPAGVLAVLQRRLQTGNGVFGIKLRALDIHLFGAAAFFAAFGPDTTYFCLWRENVVAQGISLYRAIASGRWHSYDAPRPPPAYDAADIATWIAHVIEVENDNLDLLAARGIAATWLRYEDIVRRDAHCIALFAARLGLPLPPGGVPPARRNALTAVADAWNADTEARFRAEEGPRLAGLMARRRLPARAG